MLTSNQLRCEEEQIDSSCLLYRLEQAAAVSGGSRALDPGTKLDLCFRRGQPLSFNGQFNRIKYLADPTD